MAKRNYEHVFSAAGFSGEKWDISKGHDQQEVSGAGAITFTTGTKKITTSGTFPAWMRVVGTRFTVTGSANNNFTFTVVASASATEITVLESLTTETPAGAVTFDGSPDLGIQDVLLKSGNGALTVNAPHALVSTGNLTSSRTLDLSAMEVETAAEGAGTLNGRIVYLSVQNSDIGPTKTLTLNGTVSINGASTLVISKAGDYLLHHISGGVWRANVLPSPSEVHATIARVTFAAADWSNAPDSQLKIIASGSPGTNEVGPHGLAAADSYSVYIIQTDVTPHENVDVETQFDNSNGDITLRRPGLARKFAGIAVIIGSLS